MRNIALKLMYNGTAYHGWQMQRTEASVQETLQRGLSMVCGERVRLTGVGRTDAGVHAERYVANFRTSSRIPIDRLSFAVNTHTPEDIVVREALEVADDFNAIGSCLKKEYTYRIYNSRIKNPFYVNRAYFYPKKLDEAVMDAAARAFEGTHDFRAVRSVAYPLATAPRSSSAFGSVSRTRPAPFSSTRSSGAAWPAASRSVSSSGISRFPETIARRQSSVTAPKVGETVPRVRRSPSWA